MSEGDDVSAGGSRIYRHEARERSFTPPPVPSATEEIARHFAARLGEPSTVFHEVVSDLVHLDVHLIAPAARRDFWTLFTTGMSDLPMHTPAPELARFAELLVCLPAAWRVDLLRQTPPPPDLENWYWPIRWLKKLARLPHEYDTWLGPHHTVPNGDPPRPFATDTRLCCWMLVPPTVLPGDARTVTLADGRVVSLMAMQALYPEEMQLKLERGGDELVDAFGRADIGPVLQLDRPSAVRRKRFGLF